MSMTKRDVINKYKRPALFKDIKFREYSGEGKTRRYRGIFFFLPKLHISVIIISSNIITSTIELTV